MPIPNFSVLPLTFLSDSGWVFGWSIGRLPDTSTKLWAGLLIGILAGMVLGLWLMHKLRALWVGLVLARRRRRGERGERKARQALERMGFTILQEQATHRATLLVNGEPHPYQVRADFLVSLDGETAVVEVKTGERATRPTDSATRRQLLEYLTLFGTRRIYLFDAETMELKSIGFEGLSEARDAERISKAVRLGYGLFGFLIGAGTVWFLRYALA